MTNTCTILVKKSIIELNNVNMKPVAVRAIENIAEDQLFSVKEIVLSNFSNEFHFYHECQLVYILESKRRRITGDRIEYFEEDEVFF